MMRLILSLIGVDECSSVGLNQCAHQCVDRLSGYECRCRPGYKLMGDKKSCRGKICCSFEYLVQGYITFFMFNWAEPEI